MGRVLFGQELRLEREVAIKISLAKDNSVATRFVAESKITAKLPHPGIPPVYALGELADGSPYLVMKLVRGKDLEALLRERRSTGEDLARWLAVFEQICQAVGYAHSLDIVHRDLKPANVMVGAFGEVHVMDWGLAKELNRSQGRQFPRVDEAKAIQGDTVETQAGIVLGTPSYLPPEQAQGQAVDARADVFSLGGILCNILTGKPPLRGKSAAELVQLSASGSLEETHERLDQCNLDIELIELAKKCLSASREQRPSNASEVAELVSDYRASVVDRLRQAENERATAEVRLGESRKRRRLISGAAALTILLLVCGIAGTAVGLSRANDAVRNLTLEQAKTQEALAAVTSEQKRTASALEKLTESRVRNVGNLREITEELVEDRLGRQAELNEADRALVNGLLPMWEEVAAAQGETLASKSLRADGCYQVGRLQEWLGQSEDAEQSFRTALSIQNELTDYAPEVEKYRQTLALYHNSIAIFFRNVGRNAEAEQNYLDAISVMTRLSVEEPLNVTYQQDLAGWYNNLGRFVQRMGRRDEAVEHLERSLRKREELLTQYPKNVEFRRDLAQSKDNLGVLFIEMQNLEAAEEVYQDVLAIRQRLVDEVPDEKSFKLDLANTYNNLGVLAYSSRDYLKAAEHLRSSADVKLILADAFPSVPKYREELSITFNNIAGLMVEAGEPQKAVDASAEAIKQSKFLAERFPEVPDHRRNLASAYHNLATIHQATKEYSEAESALQDALRMRKQLASDYPKIAYYQEDVVESLLSLVLLSGAQHRAQSNSQVDFEKQAIDRLRQILEAQIEVPNDLVDQPDMVTLRESPGFQAFMKESGFESESESSKPID